MLEFYTGDKTILEKYPANENWRERMILLVETEVVSTRQPG
jgi:hypothetical protein